MTEFRHALRFGQALFAARQGGERLVGAQQVAHPVRQDRPRDRLGHEIGGAGLVGAIDRRSVVQACHHQHRNSCTVGQPPQRHTGIETIDARHHHVEQHHIGPQVGKPRQTGFAILRLFDAETIAFERLAHQHAHHAAAGPGDR